MAVEKDYHFLDMLIWSIFGLFASIIRAISTSKPIKPIWIIIRGLVGAVVGLTVASIVNIKYGYDWSVPWALISSWFAQEIVNACQYVVDKKSKLIIEKELDKL